MICLFKNMLISRQIKNHYICLLIFMIDDSISDIESNCLNIKGGLITLPLTFKHQSKHIHSNNYNYEN